MRRRSWLLVIVLLAVAGVTVHFVPIGNWIAGFIGWVRARGMSGAFVYGAAYVVGTVLWFPGTALTLGGGLLYGPVWGVLLVSPASVLGATLAFVVARYLFRDSVARKANSYLRFQAIDRAIGKHGFKVVLLMRLEPVFIPFAMLNYVLGVTQVRLRDYVLASWIGMLPATIAYVYAGSALSSVADILKGNVALQGWRTWLFWSGLAASLLLLWLLVRIAREALHRELGANPAAEFHSEVK